MPQTFMQKQTKTSYDQLTKSLGGKEKVIHTNLEQNLRINDFQVFHISMIIVTVFR